MDLIARRVAARYLSADSESDLRKFRQLSGRAEKELATLPRLFKTLDRQSHSYKGADPVKAKATRVKIMAKVKAIFTGHSAALHLVEAFESTYVPSTPYKTRIFSHDLSVWLKKYQGAMKHLSQEVRDAHDGPLGLYSLSSGLEGGYVAPGENPLIDLNNAASSIVMYWDTLIRPDHDPVNVPVGGSDTERFLAYLTPSIRRLAKQTATKIKKNKAVARPLVWLVLEDVNASSQSSIAKGLLSHSGDEDDGLSTARALTQRVSTALDFNVVEAGAFGVALLEEVGDGALAQRLTAALAKAFARETTPD